MLGGLNATALNATAANLTASALPDSYLTALLGLNEIPWQQWEALNTTANITQWDTPTLKTWLQNYILYHNTIAPQFA